MPTYEYACRDCGHTFDIVQSMWDEALTMCPECGGSLRKVFAPPAISFKGSGFYATDHGKKSKRSGEAKDDGRRSGDKGEKKGSAGSKESSTDATATQTTSKPAKREPAPS
jgi:putative FmdB family regulatory protein